MTYVPDIKNGVKLITEGYESIIHNLHCQADMAMARLEVERTESYAEIKTRHENEIKAAKRNFKHRSKKIKGLMKDFNDMDPMALADLFREGVPADAVSNKLKQNWLYGDWTGIEHRVLTNATSFNFRSHGRQHGKSEAFARMSDELAYSKYR
jgi:hypothetical protein